MTYVLTIDCFVGTVQQVSRHAGSTAFLYESDVLSWSKVDFSFSYAVRTHES